MADSPEENHLILSKEEAQALISTGGEAPNHRTCYFFNGRLQAPTEHSSFLAMTAPDLKTVYAYRKADLKRFLDERDSKYKAVNPFICHPANDCPDSEKSDALKVGVGDLKDWELLDAGRLAYCAHQPNPPKSLSSDTLTWPDIMLVWANCVPVKPSRRFDADHTHKIFTADEMLGIFGPAWKTKFGPYMDEPNEEGQVRLNDARLSAKQASMEAAIRPSPGR